MILEIIKQFKWFDIFILIILLRACYVSLKVGVPSEMFKLFGTGSAIYLSLHYYTALSDFFNARLTFNEIPLDFFDFIIFVLLAAIGYLIFFLLRFTFLHMVKIETISLLNRWGGLVVGIIRGILLIGLISYMLVISTINYLKSSVVNSYFGNTAIQIAPAIYRTLWDGIISKFMAQEKFNDNISETEKSLKK